MLDNITEHLDVIQTFQLMLHRKRGRLGPVHNAISAAVAAAPAAGPAVTGSLVSAAARGPSSLQQLASTLDPANLTHTLSAAAGVPGGTISCNHALDAGEEEPEPGMLKVVHVLHPNEPIKPPAAAAAVDNGSNGEAATGPQAQPGSRPGSSGALKDSRATGGNNSRPGSSSMLSKRAAGRAAAAESGMDSIDSLDAGEMLEMLLLVRRALHG